MPLPNLTQLHHLVQTAGRAVEVFGALGGGRDEQTAALNRIFRTLVQIAHPDHCPGDLATATITLQKLQLWRRRALEEIAAGSYGTATAPLTLALRTGTYDLHEPLQAGDYYTLYRCTSPRGDPTRAIRLKLARDTCDNDLLRHEAQVLRHLAHGPAPGRRYFPQFLEAFLWQDGGASRQAVITARPPHLVLLADIRAAYPKGLDPRDAAWMFNRTLEALWFAHQQDRVHGAVLPPNLYVSLEDHGLILDQWAFAVACDQPLFAVSAAYAAWYPPEVPHRARVMPGTDLFLAARCLVYLLGGDPLSGQLPAGVPEPMCRFIRGCLLGSSAHRPQDAGSLREEFADLLKKLYGPRKFRPLAMPA